MQILIQTLVPQGKGALLSKEQKENPHRSFLDLGTTGSSGWIVCFGGFPVHWSAAFLGSSYWRPVEALHPAMTVVTTENIHRHCQRPPDTTCLFFHYCQPEMQKIDQDPFQT